MNWEVFTIYYISILSFWDFYYEIRNITEWVNIDSNEKKNPNWLP